MRKKVREVQEEDALFKYPTFTERGASQSIATQALNTVTSGGWPDGYCQAAYWPSPGDLPFSNSIGILYEFWRPFMLRHTAFAESLVSHQSRLNCHHLTPICDNVRDRPLMSGFGGLRRCRH